MVMEEEEDTLISSDERRTCGNFSLMNEIAECDAMHERPGDVIILLGALPPKFGSATCVLRRGYYF